ncbi:MAG: hypothetical protein KDD53_10655, partial [Bdellovibrionales bacterium]|nr:hypothetical protein [Bdellovibrionales bacterium]
TRTGAATAPKLYDFAIDPPQLEMLEQPSNSSLKVKVKVANLGQAVTPSKTLHLYISGVDENGKLLPFAPETLIQNFNVSLPSTNGYSLSQDTYSQLLPDNSGWMDLLEQGYSLRIRAEIVAASDEWSSLNNSISRDWKLEHIPYVP